MYQSTGMERLLSELLRCYWISEIEKVDSARMS